jgi:iron complex outermembrane receptor protein
MDRRRRCGCRRGRYFLGDDASRTQAAGYLLVNLRASYHPIKGVELFLRINNVLDRRYALFGTYFDPGAAANVGLPVELTDHRSEVLGQPLSVYGGLRVTF